MENLKSKKLIGYYGFPGRSVLRSVRERFGRDLELVDLDVARSAPDSRIIQSTTCRIIANIVDNAIELSNKLVAIVADVGEGKCDRGRYAAFLLKEEGFNVIESRFLPEQFEKRPLVYSTAEGSLAERVDRIMEMVVQPPPPDNHKRACEPTHGFWGVPPHDFRILDIFPPTTHIYGWTRCVEAGSPGDLEMECYVGENVPTVFFTQSFCAKQDLAHHLAEKYDGLFVDCHRNVNNSILSKVEAFIKLSYPDQ